MTMATFSNLALALLAVLLWSHIGARLYLLIRTRAYALTRRRDTSRPRLADLEQLSALSNLVRGEHDEARHLQDSYHYALAMTVASLLLGFILFAAEATILPESDRISTFVAWVDVVALVVVLFFVWRALVVTEQWIRQRAKTELLRQYIFISEGLFWRGTPRPGDLTGRFAAVRQDIESRLPRKAQAVSAYVERFWAERRAEILRSAGAIEADILFLSQHYLINRIQRQIAWFISSHARLEWMEKSKARTLLILLLIALLASVIKVAILATGSHGLAVSVLSFVFLLSVGLGTALTTLYFNQNARSLIHRYRMQAKRLKQIEQRLASRVVDDGKVTPVVLLDAVIEFEDLMVTELVDWIFITRNDVVEPGP